MNNSSINPSILEDYEDIETSFGDDDFETLANDCPLHSRQYLVREKRKLTISWKFIFRKTVKNYSLTGRNQTPIRMEIFTKY